MILDAAREGGGENLPLGGKNNVEGTTCSVALTERLVASTSARSDVVNGTVVEVAEAAEEREKGVERSTQQSFFMGPSRQCAC